MACGAGVWRAGATPSGMCGGLLRLVLQVRVSRAVLCRSVPRRVLLWRVALWRAVGRCAVVSRCAVVGQWRSAWPVSWCGVRAGVWLAGGRGVWLGVGVSLGLCCGGLGVLPGLVGRVGVRGVALPGGLCLGPVSSGGSGPQPWSLWPCLPPLPVPVRWPLWRPGSSPGGEGVVVRRAAAFPAASSVGVARSPRVGVPSIPRLVSGGWWVCACVIRTAPDACFGGACWGVRPRESCGVLWGWGTAVPPVVVWSLWVWVVAFAMVPFSSAPWSPLLPLPGSWVVFCPHVVSLQAPCPYGCLPSLGAPPCPLV